MTAVLTDLRERWDDASSRAQLAVALPALAALVAIFYNAPGTGDYLADKAPWGIVVAGMITGTVTALLAMGLILIYRTNRFINFAYGSMGSFAGVTAIGLHLEKGVNFYLALAIGVAIGILTGAVVDLIVRRFRTSSRLILTVASLGIGQMLAVIEFLIATKVLDFISLTGGFKIPLDLTMDMGVKTLTGDEILVMFVVPPILLGLAWFLLRTDVGIAVRAAAENEDRALLLGIPIRRLSTIVWMVAGGLAALTFVLKAPSQGVVPGVATTGPVVLLPALAAAVVARMESLPTAFVAGVGIGIMEQVVRWNTSGSPTLQNALFLVVILGALLLQRGRLSRAQEGATSSWSATAVLKPIPEELRRLPEVRWSRYVLFACVAAALLLVPNTFGPSNQFLAAVAMVWAMTAVSLVVLTGWGGHISLGQFAIVGVGALVAGNLIVDHNTDFLIALAAAGAAGAIVSLLVGLPALRIRGLFLAVTTLALAVALDKYVINVNNFPEILPSGVERPLLWERIDLNDGYNMYVTCLVFLGLSILAAHGVRKARAGRVIIATRDNQRAADAAAVPTTNVKLAAFLLAGIIAGVAGGLHVLLLTSVEQGSYQPTDSITLFSTAVIGGLGSVAGAVTGVLLFRYVETITALGDIRPLLTGGVLLFVLFAFPGGIGQLLYNVRDRILVRIAKRREILVPSLVADKRKDEGKHAEDEVGLLRSALGTEADRETVGAGR
ncbi:MAG TPA: ABC transporter permease [Acidimicrobiales bacterium]|nr:ABC transporter permease [Acidimicrobiales bacterium]